jgi:ABC-type Zn uptake system ZnuABC Zn-binding protein ZnuA
LPILSKIAVGITKYFLQVASIMRRRTLSFAALLASLLVVGSQGCSKVPPVWDTAKTGPKVMTSFAPLYCFAANVAGDDAQVLCLLTTTGPHDFHPTGRDSLKVQDANLFFINGLGLDEDFAKSLQQSANPKLKVIELAESLEEQQKELEARRKEKKDEGKDFQWLLPMKHSAAHAGHHHGEFDPHVWLGIPQAIFMVEQIRDALIAQDGAHQQGYTQRAADYIAKLKKLQEDGTKELAGKKDRNLISFHESLGYFAQTFHLNIVASLEPVAGTEPDANRIAEIVKLCRDKNVRLIAVEPQYPQNTSAQVLLDEIKKKGVNDPALVEIDPIETAKPDQLDKDYYEKKMRDNLKRLAEKMK